MTTPNLPAPDVEPDISDGSDDAIDAPESEPDLVADAIDTLAAQVARFHDRAQQHESTIRQMQQRIEELQGDQVRALLKPLITQLAGIHAQAGEASARAAGRGDEAEKDLAFLADKIEESLNSLDIESIGAIIGGVFDGRLHHASRAVPTDDPSLDRTVQRVHRQGFIYSDGARPLIPAQVSVYRYEAAVETAPSDEAAESAPDAPGTSTYSNEEVGNDQ